MKLLFVGKLLKTNLAATFGWLCVETTTGALMKTCANRQPPSGGCVLKLT